MDLPNFQTNLYTTSFYTLICTKHIAPTKPWNHWLTDDLYKNFTLTDDLYKNINLTDHLNKI